MTIHNHVLKRDRLRAKSSEAYEQNKANERAKTLAADKVQVASESLSGGILSSAQARRKRIEDRKKAVNEKVEFTISTLKELLINTSLEACILDNSYVLENMDTVFGHISSVVDTVFESNNCNIVGALESPNAFMLPYANLITFEEVSETERDELVDSKSDVVDVVTSKIKDIFKAEIEASKRNKELQTAIEESTSPIRNVVTEGTLLRAFMILDKQHSLADEGVTVTRTSEELLGRAILSATVLQACEEFGLLNWNKHAKAEFIEKTLRRNK
jgi:hypothetical protein